MRNLPQCLYGNPTANNFFQKLNSGQLMNRKVKMLGKRFFTKFEGCSWARKRSIAIQLSTFCPQIDAVRWKKNIGKCMKN